MAAKKIKITTINPISLGNFIGIFYSIIGIFIGIIIAFGSTFAVWFGQTGVSFFQALGLGIAVGLFSIVLIPIVYFIFGWVQGVIFGFIFNIVASHIGGLEIETK